MNERQAHILGSVIEEFTLSAIPVGSRVIVEKYVKDVSPATIRNDMAQLEKDGFLYQPHVSSGRIPTDKGYRYFIESIMEDRDLSREETIEVRKELLQLKAKNARLARTTAKLLSMMSGHMAFSGLVDKDEYYEFGLKHLLEGRENDDLDDMCRLVEVLDTIDERVEAILHKVRDGETKIFVGRENPIREMRGYSMIVSPFRNGDGERGVIALIGPKRMPYARNKSLVEFLKKLIQSSKVWIIVGSFGTIVLR